MDHRSSKAGGGRVCRHSVDARGPEDLRTRGRGGYHSGGGRRDKTRQMRVIGSRTGSVVDISSDPIIEKRLISVEIRR